MGCKSCEKQRHLTSKVKNVIVNTFRAGKGQKDIIKWFREGVDGIIKCLGHEINYTDEEIRRNRDICSGCEHATEKDEQGFVTLTSQCMAPDPETGEACGCFLVCKTQVDNCTLGKFKYGKD